MSSVALEELSKGRGNNPDEVTGLSRVGLEQGSQTDPWQRLTRVIQSTELFSHSWFDGSGVFLLGWNKNLQPHRPFHESVWDPWIRDYKLRHGAWKMQAFIRQEGPDKKNQRSWSHYAKQNPGFLELDPYRVKLKTSQPYLIFTIVACLFWVPKLYESAILNHWIPLKCHRSKRKYKNKSRIVWISK